MAVQGMWALVLLAGGVVQSWSRTIIKRLCAGCAPAKAVFRGSSTH